MAFPHFTYNGDTTSEVYVTLDKNPAVTNPTTSFRVFHGDPDTTSTGANAGYHWGGNGYYTEPNLNDPSGGFSELFNTPGYGTYNENYLSTSTRSTTTESFTLYSSTDCTMSYDISDLVAGETYRRGMALWNIRVPNGKVYDTLYFNIEVIDSSVPEVIYAHFLYNGDTTSEVYVTLDKNPAVTNPTTEFSIFQGTPIISGFYRRTWGLYYSGPQENDPDNGFTLRVPSITNGSGYGAYDANYLVTEDTWVVLVDNSITDHIMEYDITDLTAGETYIRDLPLIEQAVFSGLTSIDTLRFHLTIIDTTEVIPTIPKRRNSGTYYNLVI